MLTHVRKPIHFRSFCSDLLVFLQLVLTLGLGLSVTALVLWHRHPYTVRSIGNIANFHRTFLTVPIHHSPPMYLSIY